MPSFSRRNMKPSVLAAREPCGGLSMSNVKRVTVSAQPDVCPRCGATQVAAILYGLPDSIDRHLLESGAVVLGGCIVTGDDPIWHCTQCDLNFGRANGSGMATVMID